EAIPVPIAGAGGVDEAVVVEASTLALVEPARGRGAERAPVARAHRRLAAGGLSREGDAAEVDHGVLHRHLDVLAAARALALMQGGQDADRTVQSSACIADGRSGLERLGFPRAREAQRAAHRLPHHVQSPLIL